MIRPAIAMLVLSAACAPVHVPLEDVAPTTANGSASASATRSGPGVASVGQVDPALLAAARAVIERSNAARAAERARPLREAPELMRAAQDYAEELARLGRLSHTSPTTGRITMVQRIEAAGGSYRRAAENLAATNVRIDLADTIIEMWLSSQGHRRNLLDPGYTTTGAGVARDGRGVWYVVQLYVLPPARR